MTHAGVADTEKLVDYLVNRLRKSEHNIKEKTLNVIKVCAAASPASFKHKCACVCMTCRLFGSSCDDAAPAAI